MNTDVAVGARLGLGIGMSVAGLLLGKPKNRPVYYVHDEDDGE